MMEAVVAKKMEPTEQETRACGILDSFVPDLLAMKKYDLFLRNLFGCEKGKWLSVRKLCVGLGETEEAFESLASLADTELVVVWMDHPWAAGEYAYVHFYFDTYFWTNSAIYNLKSITSEVGTS
jgi:hypothetical protein